jgi:hypothetical protein
LGRGTEVGRHRDMLIIKPDSVPTYQVELVVVERRLSQE